MANRRHRWTELPDELWCREFSALEDFEDSFVEAIARWLSVRQEGLEVLQVIFRDRRFISLSGLDKPACLDCDQFIGCLAMALTLNPAPRLHTLSIHSHSSDKIFPVICGVTQLQRLHVDDYNLPDINSISCLSRLTWLHLSSCTCERWPGNTARENAIWQGIAQLRELRYLHVGELGHATLPQDISNLQHLSHLWMFSSVTGSALPSSMSKMTNLAWLRLRDTYRDFSSLNIEGGKLRCLQLEPSHPFSEEVENNFSVTKLQGLRAFHYAFMGDADGAFTRGPAVHIEHIFDGIAMSNLRLLSIENLSLWYMPTVICSSLSNLKLLSLANNFLTDLPDQLSMLTNLKSVDLRSNLFSEVPSRLSSILGLERLVLVKNEGIVIGDDCVIVLEGLRSLRELYLAKVSHWNMKSTGNLILLAQEASDDLFIDVEDMQVIRHGQGIKLVEDTIRFAWWDL